MCFYRREERQTLIELYVIFLYVHLYRCLYCCSLKAYVGQNSLKTQVPVGGEANCGKT